MDNAEFITRSSVIGIDSLDITTDHMQQDTKKFLEGVESKIGNYWQPIYNNTAPENMYCSAFGDDNDMDDPPLPYGDEIIDSNMDEIGES